LSLGTITSDPGYKRDEAGFAKGLQYELLTVLARLLFKIDGEVRDMRRALQEHLAACPIDRSVKLDGSFVTDSEKWWHFSAIMLHTLGGPLSMVVIENALTSSLFLSQGPESGAYVQSPAYDALFKLTEEIRLYNQAATAKNLAVVDRFSRKKIGRVKREISLPTQEVLTLYGLAHRWINIVSLALALIRHLEDKPFIMPELMPHSPIQGVDEEAAQARVTVAEGRAALGL